MRRQKANGIKKLVALALFFPLSVGATEFWHEFSKSFSTGVQPPLIIGGGVVIIAGIFFLVYSEISKADQRFQVRSEIGWKKFFEGCEKCGLKEEEKDLLEKLVRAIDVRSAETVFTSPVVFEQAVENFFSRLKSRKQASSEVLLKELHLLREQLGYANLPIETPYISTRQFRLGDKILMKVEDGAGGSSTISDMNENQWGVTNSLKTNVPTGTRIRVSLTRAGDAEYTVETTVEHSTPQQLVLAHTRKLKRKQLRNWVRVDVNFPIRARILRVKDGAELEEGQSVLGRALDLSGGGLSLRVPVKLHKEALLSCSFELAGKALNNIEASVIRVASAAAGSDGMYTHSVEFLELETQSQERIVRFVFEKQRQDSQWR